MAEIDTSAASVISAMLALGMTLGFAATHIALGDGFPSKSTVLQRYRIGIQLSIVAILGVAHPCPVVASPPQLSGIISSRTNGPMFAVRWEGPCGEQFKAWLRMGERAGDFRLVEYDPNREVLLLEDRLGCRHELTLPQARVREQEMTDSEFMELLRYMRPGADKTSAPVLTREKARQFYLRWLSEPPELSSIQVFFDLGGTTLPADQQARWQNDRIKMREAGRLLLAVIIDGKTRLEVYPLKSHLVPEPMTRYLGDSDWDEIALLDATRSIKRRILERQAPTNNRPR